MILAGIPGTRIGYQMLFGKESPQLNSQQRIEEIISEERAKLEIKPEVNIEANFKTYSRSAKFGENQYCIELAPAATEATLRHEVYHIRANHCDRLSKLPHSLGTAYYFLWAEPRAAYYEWVGSHSKDEKRKQ